MKYGLGIVLSVCLCVVMTGCGTVAHSSHPAGPNSTATTQTKSTSRDSSAGLPAAPVKSNPASKAAKVAAKSTVSREPAAQVRTSPPKQQPIVLSLGSQGTNVELLQELLSVTGYLPLEWTGQHSWHWKYASTPKSLVSLWSPTKYTLLTKSAVMTFEEVHHLAVDGVAGPQVFAALKSDAAAHRTSPYGFTYVQVSLAVPESLSLWHNGQIIIKSLANSGIPQSPTVTGTYPVYLQYLSQTMKGKDPNGQHYSDPGVPYVSYFYGGEAVHGFVRSQYGYPQSLGCVELPIPAAKQVWPYMHLGTLVNIT